MMQSPNMETDKDVEHLEAPCVIMTSLASTARSGSISYANPKSCFQAVISRDDVHQAFPQTKDCAARA